MQRIVSLGLLSALMSTGVIGCQAPPVPLPSNITLSDALVDVKKSLEKMQTEGDPGKTNGIYPADVTVEFNVAVGGTNNSQLVLAAGITGPVGVATGTASATGTSGSTTTGSVSNKITIKFTNVLDMKKETFGYEKTAEFILKFIEDMRKGGFGIKMKPPSDQ